jgi:hypothetical protein
MVRQVKKRIALNVLRLKASRAASGHCSLAMGLKATEIAGTLIRIRKAH